MVAYAKCYPLNNNNEEVNTMVDNSHSINILQTTPAEIMESINVFFPTEKYNISSVCRKALNLLMYLAAKYPGSWYVNFEYSFYEHKCTTRILNNEYKAGLYITDKATDENIRVHKNLCTGLIDKLFAKDRFIPVPVEYSKVKLFTEIGNFILEKSKASTANSLLYTIHVKSGCWTPRAFWYRRFGKPKEVIDIRKYKVIKQELDRSKDGEKR